MQLAGNPATIKILVRACVPVPVCVIKECFKILIGKGETHWMGGADKVVCLLVLKTLFKINSFEKSLILT